MNMDGGCPNQDQETPGGEGCSKKPLGGAGTLKHLP